MKSILIVFPLLTFSLSAQTLSLKAALYALTMPDADRTTVTRQLADAMMPLAQPNHEPTRHSVDDFASELARVMAGKELAITQVARLERAISEMMRGSVANFTSTGHLRDALTAIHIDSLDAGAITRRFLAIGEEVRGPDDLMLMKLK